MEKSDFKKLLLRNIPKEDIDRVEDLNATMGAMMEGKTHEECWDLAVEQNIKLLKALSQTRRKEYTYGVRKTHRENLSSY